MRIAALFVLEDGPYAGLEDVDVWGITRDARQYPGPHPVVAHPPCARWGRYWSGGPSYKGPPLKKGDDGGCFWRALQAVRQWGGVLEHPADSHAWTRFSLAKPPKSGGWVTADWEGGYTCHVEQGAYGHKARKGTWLYAVPSDPKRLPALRWGKAPGSFTRLDDWFHSKEERAKSVKRGVIERLSVREREATPHEFRDILLGIARTCG